LKRKNVVWLLILLALAMLVVTQALAGAVYHGNVKSGVFHGPNCRYFNCKNCTAVFNNRQAAIAAGYRPCKICKP
jgi:methylphosphotriester-DNA--protein-cysteine methyltransferase